MQYSQEHLKTMVYAEFGGQTECIMGNWKIENIILFTSIILMAIACLVIDQTKFSSNYCKKKKISIRSLQFKSWATWPSWSQHHNHDLYP